MNFDWKRAITGSILAAGVLAGCTKTAEAPKPPAPVETPKAKDGAAPATNAATAPAPNQGVSADVLNSLTAGKQSQQQVLHSTEGEKK